MVFFARKYVNQCVSRNRMRAFFFFILLLTLSLSVEATSIRKYTKSKDGFTLITGISGKEDSLMFDAFFDRLLNRLKRDDKSIPILLLIDYSGIKNNRKGHGFASLAVDTLRIIDPSFIGAYYYHRLGKTFEENYQVYEPYPSNKYLTDLPEPIDINSSFQSMPSTVGLKIMYNYGAADSIIVFDRIYTLVQYGISNMEKVKREQKRIAVDYQFGTAKVSFLTVDTNVINRLPLLTLGFDPKDMNHPSFTKAYLFGVIGVLVVVLLLYFWKRQRLTEALKKSG